MDNKDINVAMHMVERCDRSLDYKTIWNIAVGELPQVKTFFEGIIQK